MIVFKWIKRIILGIIALILLVILIGFIYEQITRLIDSNKIKPSGEYTNVGDHKLYFAKGGVGVPTVVFESGLETGGHLSWKYVQTEIAKQTTTISYDRAGILWSERGDNPKSARAMAAELYTLLENTNCPKPYILVGHSFAGITLRPFITENRNNISGVVFVDVSHPDQMNRIPNEIKELMQPQPKWLVNTIFSLGINRMLYNLTYPGTKENDSINIIANTFGYKSMSSQIEEMENFEVIAEEVFDLTQFDSIPLSIITGTDPKRYEMIPNEKLRPVMEKIWNDLQIDLLGLSTNSQHILAPKSGHYVQLEQPEIVIKAIESMIMNTKINE